MPNRLANVNDTLLSTYIGQNAITWGKNYDVTGAVKDIWNGKCMLFPDGGFFKRENERFVLPHAIGCQPPTNNYEYDLILQGIV